MTNESAVSFPTPTRVHVGLAVRDVPRAVEFYRALLDQEPTKLRPGYAKFEVLDPPLNLSLNETPHAIAPALPQHFGIQVKQRASIGEIAGRVTHAGFTGLPEQGVTCCYAVQDKVWLTDPDGHRWEVFLVTQADTTTHSDRPTPVDAVAPCCGPQTEPTRTSEPPCCGPTCCR